MGAAESRVNGVAASCAVLAVVHGGLSDGIRGLLSTRFESVVLVADERSLTACLEALHPDLLVLELEFVPGPGAGIELLRRLRRSHAGVPILLLVDDADRAIAAAAAAAGADGCLLKQALGRDLLEAVEKVLAGGKAFWSGEDRQVRERTEPALPGADRKNGEW